jgi:hypothetical protein
LQAELDELDHEMKTRRNRLVLMLRARQKVELLKIPCFVERAKYAIEEGMSVPIFVNFRKTLLEIAERLDTDCIIMGGMGNRVFDSMERFQNDESRVIVCQSESGGVGISLHDIRGEYPRKSLISPGWSAQTLLQITGRVCRAGGQSKSYQEIIFAEAGIEEQVCHNVNEKLANLHTVNDMDMNAGLRIF